MRKLFIIALLIASPAFAASQKALQQNMTADSTTYAISLNTNYVTLIDKTQIPQKDGTMAYCTDCKQTPVCVPGGKGAQATRIKGEWLCGLGINGTMNTINPGNIGQYAGYVGPDQTTLGPMPNPLDFYTGPISITGNQTIGADQINNVSVNGELSATTFGAKGDGIYSGDLTHLQDATTTTNGTVVSIPSFVFPKERVGNTIFIDGAGASGGMYIGTVTGLAGNYLYVNPPTPTGINNSYYVMGTDDTTPLQNWLNALRHHGTTGYGQSPSNSSGYLPGATDSQGTTGVYITRGLNWGGVYGISVRGAGLADSPGGGQYGGTTILCMLPNQNPQGLPANQVGCNDFTGAALDTIRDMRFKNGNTFGLVGSTPQGPESGYWNVLLARHPTAGFAISNTFENVSFQSWGQYNVIINNSEQNSWINDTFNDNGNTAVGLYLTTNYVFSSPFYGAMTGAGQSTTLNRFSGGATQFSSNGYYGPGPTYPEACAIQIDGGPSDFSINDAYVRLNGPNDDFLCDQGKVASMAAASFKDIRVEPDTQGIGNSNDHFINFTNAGSVWNGGELHNITWGLGNTQAAPIFNVPNGAIEAVNFSNFESTSWPNPLVVVKNVGDNAWGNLNAGWIQVNGQVMMPVSATRRAWDGALGAYNNTLDAITLESNNVAAGANDWVEYNSGTGTGAPWGAGGMGWQLDNHAGGSTNIGGFTGNGTFVDPIGVNTNKLAASHPGCQPGAGTPGAIGVYTIQGCDAHGLIHNYQDGSGHITLSFNQPFSSVAVCTLTPLGNDYLWYTNAQTASGIQLWCSTTIGTQTNCPDGMYVAYNCFATGNP